MYDLIPFFLGGLMIVLGLYMFISPVKATKTEFRNNPKMVSKTKRNSVVVICCGIATIVIAITRIM